MALAVITNPRRTYLRPSWPGVNYNTPAVLPDAIHSGDTRPHFRTSDVDWQQSLSDSGHVGRSHGALLLSGPFTVIRRMSRMVSRCCRSVGKNICLRGNFDGESRC